MKLIKPKITLCNEFSYFSEDFISTACVFFVVIVIKKPDIFLSDKNEVVMLCEKVCHTKIKFLGHVYTFQTFYR